MGTGEKGRRASFLQGPHAKGPWYWYGGECHVVRLLPTSEEYQNVAVQFQSTISSMAIVNIERIQNPKLYTQYLARKKTMDKGNPHCHNEQQLSHDCAVQVVDSILSIHAGPLVA